MGGVDLESSRRKRWKPLYLASKGEPLYCEHLELGEAALWDKAPGVRELVLEILTRPEAHLAKRRPSAVGCTHQSGLCVELEVAAGVACEALPDEALERGLIGAVAEVGVLTQGSRAEPPSPCLSSLATSPTAADRWLKALSSDEALGRTGAGISRAVAALRTPKAQVALARAVERYRPEGTPFVRCRQVMTLAWSVLRSVHVQEGLTPEARPIIARAARMRHCEEHTGEESVQVGAILALALIEALPGTRAEVEALAREPCDDPFPDWPEDPHQAITRRYRYSSEVGCWARAALERSASPPPRR